MLDLETLKPVGSLALPGLPVFAVVSPDKKLIAINYSGDQEDNVTIVNATTRQVLGTGLAGKRIMHLRFSPDGSRLYLSSYFDNKLKTMKTLGPGAWTVAGELQVESPAGIFYQ